MEKCEPITTEREHIIRYPDYDFTKEKASIGRNRIHDYPAMIHYGLVDKLLSEFSSKVTQVYDPFCGSGTTLVQSLAKGLSCIGTDINPLALLIAKVRCSELEPKQVYDAIQKVSLDFSSVIADVPPLTNPHYWFSEPSIIGLGKLRCVIASVCDSALRDFLLICLSSLARKLSFNRKGEFKRVRIKDTSTQLDGNIVTQFVEICYSYEKEILQNRLRSSSLQLIRHDVRLPIPIDQCVDLIITSPPYGDSMTTVAYGQYSSFGIEWLRGINPFGDATLSLDRHCLGGKLRNDIEQIKSKTAEMAYREVSKQNPKRALEVLSFLYDLQLAIEQICKTLKEGATVCFVVGNRTVQNTVIPLDLISKELFEAEGLNFMETRLRTISMKRMPSRNSPSNVSGITAETMSKEMIVILRKQVK